VRDCEKKASLYTESQEKKRIMYKLRTKANHQRKGKKNPTRGMVKPPKGNEKKDKGTIHPLKWGGKEKKKLPKTDN